MNIVNLFSIGAMRAGSTTIYNYLYQHPEIFIPDVKEPYFFVAEHIRDSIAENKLSDQAQESAEKFLNRGKYKTLSAYNSLYSEVENVKYLGDCSHYLIHPQTAQIIHRYNPKSKILVSLRNPVDRIYSEYMLYVRSGKVSESFSEFVHKMLIKSSNNKYEMKPICRLRKGLYATLLSPWLTYFGEDQLKVIFFEDLIATPYGVCQDIYDWLGIENTFQPQIVRAQRGGVPKSQSLVKIFQKRNFFTKFKKSIPLAWRWKIRDLFYSLVLSQEKMTEEMESLLKSLYLQDICQLEELLKKDLSAWK